MKKPVVFYPSIGLLFVIGVTIAFTGFIGKAWAQKSGPSAKLVTATGSRATTNTSARFMRAAAENVRLRNSLAWDFSGKRQTGWDIYVPLISHTIETESGPDTADFAGAVAAWQVKQGIDQTGIIDEATIGTFVSFWQSRRLFKFGLPAADQLVMAPIADFYDPTREEPLRQLDSQTYAAYKRMVAAAQKEAGLKLFTYATGEKDERFLRIVSGYRSQEYQDSLRKKEPKAGRGALAKASAHSTGRAIDVFVGGEPVTTKDVNRLVQVQTPAYRWLVKNAERFGFVPYFYEPWHWEFVPNAIH
jgi:D-alanyl-D-alanine carboxypeptidase